MIRASCKFLQEKKLFNYHYNKFAPKNVIFLLSEIKVLLNFMILKPSLAIRKMMSVVIIGNSTENLGNSTDKAQPSASRRHQNQILRKDRSTINSGHHLKLFRYVCSKSCRTHLSCVHLKPVISFTKVIEDNSAAVMTSCT